MASRKYAGTLAYDDENYIEVKSLTVSERDITFELASVTEKHGRWSAAPSTKARRQADGIYVASGVKASQNGVAADIPWDITFKIEHEDSGRALRLSGTLIEGTEVSEFEGELGPPARRQGHMTGMRGVYLVAAQLTKLGFIASPTSRSAVGADILVTNQSCTQAFSVQVKANASSFGFWLVGKKAKTMVSRTHIYVLVNLRERKGFEELEFYVVPSKMVADKMILSDTWCQINIEHVRQHRDKWSLFGDPQG